MKHLGIKISLFLNYLVFAFLLNSVGAVILQVQRSLDVSKVDASLLEGFKDIPIAITSFILASFLPKIGLKKAMLISLALVGLMCFATTFANEFWFFKLLFLAIGISFAMVKVSVFASIGLITDGQKEHASFMGILEAIFMAGVLIGNILFSFFIDDANPKSMLWLNMYWVMGAISSIAFLVLFFSKLDESAAKIEKRKFSEDFKEMLLLIIKPLTVVFIVSIFMYVLIEQSFQTWLPTFYTEILGTPASIGIQAAANLAGIIMIGRLVGGIVLRKIKWIYVLSFCLFAAGAILILVLPLAKNLVVDPSTNWMNAPLAAYLFPLIGLFLAPVYPTLNSTILSALPKHMHSSMAGLIVVFSALGGSFGSIITGNLFDVVGGDKVFYFTLIPLTIILIAIWILHKMVSKQVVA